MNSVTLSVMSTQLQNYSKPLSSADMWNLKVWNNLMVPTLQTRETLEIISLSVHHLYKANHLALHQQCFNKVGL